MVHPATGPHHHGMSATTISPITVLGSTGTTGSRVLSALQRLGLTARGATRRTDPSFDWTDPESWPDVLEGCRALYLVPPEPPTTIDEFVAAAVDAGVERFVLLSARGPDQSGDDHLPRTEAAVVSLAPSWTVLRPAWFAQNFTEGYFRQGLDSGELRLPTGEGREPFVDVEDIAAVAAAALCDDAHDRQVYELSGPDSLSFTEAVAQLAHATGRAWRFAAVDSDEFVAEQTRAGTPPTVIATLLELFEAIRRGENEYISEGVQTALGRPPTSFREFAARYAPTG